MSVPTPIPNTLVYFWPVYSASFVLDIPFSFKAICNTNWCWLVLYTQTHIHVRVSMYMYWLITMAWCTAYITYLYLSMTFVTVLVFAINSRWLCASAQILSPLHTHTLTLTFHFSLYIYSFGSLFPSFPPPIAIRCATSAVVLVLVVPTTWILNYLCRNLYAVPTKKMFCVHYSAFVFSENIFGTLFYSFRFWAAQENFSLCLSPSTCACVLVVKMKLVLHSASLGFPFFFNKQKSHRVEFVSHMGGWQSTATEWWIEGAETKNKMRKLGNVL